jgi:ribose transport system substrate-binding protein
VVDARRRREMNRHDERSRGAHLHLIGVVALLIGALALAAGCGGNDVDDDVPEEATDIVAESEEMIAQAKEPIEFEPPGPEIDVGELEGQTVAIVSVDQRVPILAIANDAINEAANEAGLETTLFDARSEVTRMQEGIERAAREADALVLTGIPIAAVPGALEGAQDLPSVAVLNNQPDPDAPGQGAGELVDATSAPNYENNGALVAAQAIVDTNGELNTEIFNTEEITPSPDVVSGMRSMLDDCGTCEVGENTTPLAEWSTALTPKAQTTIRRNPELNYLLPIFDAMGIFITAGIRQADAGEQVKVASINGTPAAVQLVQEGDIFTVNAGAPVGWVGWNALDQVMRGLLGEEPGDPEVPSRLLDQENLEGVDAEDIDAPYGDPEYREGFRQLWGIE